MEAIITMGTITITTITLTMSQVRHRRTSTILLGNTLLPLPCPTAGLRPRPLPAGRRFSD
jgi:hypothetical protein